MLEKLGPLLLTYVALRKESVDRNYLYEGGVTMGVTSLSARRAWIEISGLSLPAELCRSLSARRAWIEMISAFV